MNLNEETGVWDVEGNINKMWEWVAEGVKMIAKEVISESRNSNMLEDKQTW